MCVCLLFFLLSSVSSLHYPSHSFSNPGKLLLIVSKETCSSKPEQRFSTTDICPQISMVQCQDPCGRVFKLHDLYIQKLATWVLVALVSFHFLLAA